MTRFPSETQPEKLRWLPAGAALLQLRAACVVPIVRTTFYRWLQNGMLPARRVGFRYYVAAEDIAHFARESFNP